MSRINLFDSFNKVYQDKLSNEKSRAESFDEASKDYRSKYGFDPYKDADSFMSARSQKKRKK